MAACSRSRTMTGHQAAASAAAAAAAAAAADGGDDLTAGVRSIIVTFICCPSGAYTSDIPSVQTTKLD